MSLLACVRCSNAASLACSPSTSRSAHSCFLARPGWARRKLTLEFTRYLFGGNEAYRFDLSEFLHLDNVKLLMGDETGTPGRLGYVSVAAPARRSAFR